MAKMPAPPSIQLTAETFPEVEEALNIIIQYLDELRQEIEKATA